jgi:hypothetical protein
VPGESGGPGEALSRFEGFGRVVLVANSEAVDVADLQARHAGALFVFFNKVYKVLDRPFAGDALLVARSGPAGANIVYRRGWSRARAFAGSSTCAPARPSGSARSRPSRARTSPASTSSRCSSASIRRPTSRRAVSRWRWR